MNKEFKPTNHGNETLELDDCGISYNANPGGEIESFKSDDSSDETAIIKDGCFYILNGDFRKEYANFNTFVECMEFFNKNLDKRSSWSD